MLILTVVTMAIRSLFLECFYSAMLTELLADLLVDCGSSRVLLLMFAKVGLELMLFCDFQLMVVWALELMALCEFDLMAVWPLQLIALCEFHLMAVWALQLMALWQFDLMAVCSLYCVGLILVILFLFEI